ncbi:Leucine-rich repeat family protein [Prunus dulcis]|uniref:Leucine-rich repeat family protein n=1 Tax=Prunus dulcis TaxID=3755 RepID=A0A4Y1QWJ6_PRUDU|nr:Leucine-rich repeat family protein [Prunus dulcis]
MIVEILGNVQFIGETLPKFRQKVSVFSKWARHRGDVRNFKGFVPAICAIKAKAISVDVVKFGAKGDGKTDDTKAFTQAWTQACSERQNNRYVIPKGTYIVGPVDFAGPCKAKTIHFKVDGTVQSSKKQSVTGGAHPNAWISFTQVNNLFISGDGIFDGQGFEGNCTKAKQCEQPPLNLVFAMVKDSHIQA